VDDDENIARKTGTMISSYFTHQSGLAHLDELRRDAQRRRLVSLARAPGAQSTRQRRLRLAFGALRARRAAVA
jgi:hypothetical protein